MQCITNTDHLAMSEVTSTESHTRTINVRLPLNVYQQLESLAKSTARTKSFVTVQALSSYLAAQNWQIADIEAGLEEATQGNFASDEEVNSVFKKYGA
jgi:predicted transcriptional regulator